MSIQESLARAEKALAVLRRLAAEHPEWHGRRNTVGNLVLEDDAGNFMTCVDFIGSQP